MKKLHGNMDKETVFLMRRLINDKNVDVNELALVNEEAAIAFVHSQYLKAASLLSSEKSRCVKHRLDIVPDHTAIL